MNPFNCTALSPINLESETSISVVIPGSKSSTIRAVFLAALSQKITKISNVLISDDSLIMFSALRTLGITIDQINDTEIIVGGKIDYSNVRTTIHLGSSGLSMRLLLAHSALFGEGTMYFSGDARLLERPIDSLSQCIRKLGGILNQRKGVIEIIPSSFLQNPLDLTIDEHQTSQTISAFAMVFSSSPSGGLLRFGRLASSKSYLYLTSYWLRTFGCLQDIKSNNWYIPGNHLGNNLITIEGDWSGAAAFILASATSGKPIEIYGLGTLEPQGDRYILEILKKHAVKYKWKNNALSIEGRISGSIDEDLSNCLDLAPVLSAACTVGDSVCRLRGLRNLRGKESDRFGGIQNLIEWLGGSYEIIDDDAIKIYPRNKVIFPKAPFDPNNDHRMAFAAALGCLKSGGLILNPTCVNKTFPTFWKAWSSLVT